RPSAQAAEVRRLAGEGLLRSRFRESTAADRRQLWAGAAEIAVPLVYHRVTRPVERRRGHYLCAAGLPYLAHDCLERLHDDVEAVLYDLFTHADLPIGNLEGWLTMRMPRATVDGYRRRRGERGALQRARVPVWLATELGDDTWLIELAKAILDWVGTDAVAGGSLWPLTAWAERRSVHTGTPNSGEAAVAADVETVLAAMRKRLWWYERNVEQPLSRKPVPLWFPPQSEAGTEPEPLALVAPHERDDALLGELAAAAIDLISARLDRGEDATVVVPEVLDIVFGQASPSFDLDRPPGVAEDGPEQATALITDPARLERIIAVVIDMFGGPDGRKR
ncbi:MAG: hypothetical protein ABI140_02240, partial [Jatrophihabitantaceae bacterium]